MHQFVFMNEKDFVNYSSKAICAILNGITDMLENSHSLNNENERIAKNQKKEAERKAAEAVSKTEEINKQAETALLKNTVNGIDWVKCIYNKNYDGKDFIDACRDSKGVIQEEALLEKVGNVLSCSSFMADRMIKKLQEAKINFAAYEMSGYDKKGNLDIITHFLIDAKDEKRSIEIVNDLNKVKNNRIEIEKLIDAANVQGIQLVSIDNITKEMADYIVEKGLPQSYSLEPVNEDTYKMYFPKSMSVEALESYKQAYILYSGNSEIARQNIKNERNKVLSQALSEIVDTGKSVIIIDAFSPDKQIKTTSTDIECYSHGHQIANFPRSKSTMQKDVLNVLSKYNEPVILQNTKELDKEIEKAHKEYKAELNPTELIFKYKKELIAELSEATYRTIPLEIQRQQTQEEYQDNTHLYDAKVKLQREADTLARNGNIADAREADGEAGRVDSQIKTTPEQKKRFINFFIEDVLEAKQIPDKAEHDKFYKDVAMLPALQELAEQPEYIQKLFVKECDSITASIMESLERDEMQIEDMSNERIMEEVTQFRSGIGDTERDYGYVVESERSAD